MITDDWIFKDGVEAQGSSNGFWYDLTAGGYIKPRELLADDNQLKELYKAVDIVSSFELALEKANLLNKY